MQRLPARSGPFTTEPNAPVTLAAPNAAEIDLVEKEGASRQAYRASLQALVQYYNDTGNHGKLEWAKKELAAFDVIPQYKYIVEAQVMPESYRAGGRIIAADQMYAEAEQLRRKAGFIPLMALKDPEALRAALRKYEELIGKYPTSDKIDDAAYRMGEIYESFGENEIALRCFQRTFQWDPAAPYPARYKAAEILDKKLHRRSEALQMYQEAIAKEPRYTDRKLMAERRVEQLNTSKD
jgi:tetratricopeptide (TPR) repeat protein